MSRRVAFITGASSGIGAAIAERLAPNYALVMSSLTEDRLSSAVVRLTAKIHGADVHPITIDVCKPSIIDSAVHDALQHYGRIDVLVNCAGIGGGGPTEEMSDEVWDRIIATNLSGVFRVTRAVLVKSGMRQRGWGRIINIASTGGKQGVMYAAAYSASKHGVIGFTKSLGLELAKTGITVNAVCPGFVETPLAERARESYASLWSCSANEAKQRIEARIPIGRYITPDEVSGLVEYLASDESAGVLAQAFNVCGGLGNY